MKDIKIVLLLTFCLGYPMLSGQSSDERAVDLAVETLRKAMLHPDSTVLKNLAADELVYIHSSGTVRNKQGFIDEFMKGWSVMTSLTISDQVIQLSGKNAIVRHHLTGETLNNNIPGILDIIVLQVWIKQKGHWKLLARQAAKMPD